ncbi:MULTISPECIES: BlaI/MecI/CopY family transcriptional regulator [unclassified Nocardiopsis]|uniref:BlaI/MecI/CopY family transcriptional regulator n=1 Tax=unclassified Nocardiopsis TaxID=2649073 RepID=UPI00066C7343|nr:MULTISPECIES: BlaI/MecI/CopY family transcriptional regulator [unclassified Nocardiopsis]MBQ1081035.1 BlaI/MecI/CopY family transcriptional regulator [Nocardiopsis sp. B62]
MSNTVPGLGSLESAVMAVLWAAGRPLSVREVVDGLAEREPAYTTISTVLENLRRKEWVDRERTGRLWFYRALRDRASHAADRMHGALDDSGDSQVALLRFVDRMDPRDLDLLRDLLADIPRQEEP